MKTLVTGADGFVGVWLIRQLVSAGHDVVAAVQPERPLLRVGGPPPWPPQVRTVPLEVTDDLSVRQVLAERLDAVVHLAAVASGTQARGEPERARLINVSGTLRIAGELARQHRAGESDVRLLFVSTAEVYGAGHGDPRKETDDLQPVSVYAETKVEAERGLRDLSDRAGLQIVIVRPFPHTGRGQDHRFVAPVFAKRILEAKRAGAPSVPVGNLDPVREFMHVSDVVAAYVSLLQYGRAGETYNVACGEGISLYELFRRLAEIVDCDVRPEVDPDLVRPADIPHLVGDASKLETATGWRPQRSLDETLRDVVDAQAH